MSAPSYTSLQVPAGARTSMGRPDGSIVSYGVPVASALLMISSALFVYVACPYWGGLGTFDQSALVRWNGPGPV